MMMNLSRLLADAVSVVTSDAATTTTQGTTAASGGMGGLEMLVSFLPFVLILVVMYFIMIRPQQKKDKQVKDMLANLKVGDKICTIGGLYGTITGLRDDSVVLSMGSLKNTIVVARWAIRSVENVALENDSSPEI